ncbi:NAD(P)H-hydrate dehydratase [bacterium]|nr:NAD(P)H-hydrate dehydratase [bacterium]
MEFKLPERPEISNKGTFGKVLNISGSKYMTGAAILSSQAALKSGCGYVILACDDEVRHAISTQTQSVVFAPVEKIPEILPTAQAVLIGCGLGTDETAHQIFDNVFAQKIDVPVVIDADGLNILAEKMPQNLPEKLILTPHPKEASRLLDEVSVDEILADTEKYAQKITEKYGCTTVLKSAKTVVCSGTDEIFKNNAPNSAIAKAGSGDVLSGIIVSLLAQGLDTFNSAKTGAKLHSLAGLAAREKLGKYSVLPCDIIENLPDAFGQIV